MPATNTATENLAALLALLGEEMTPALLADLDAKVAAEHARITAETAADKAATARVIAVERERATDRAYRCRAW